MRPTSASVGARRFPGYAPRRRRVASGRNCGTKASGPETRSAKAGSIPDEGPPTAPSIDGAWIAVRLPSVPARRLAADVLQARELVVNRPGADPECRRGG